MNYFYKYLIISSFMGLTTIQANSSCKNGYSVEIRKGNDVCYKYDKKTDSTHEMKTNHPRTTHKSKWKLLIDHIGHRDIWEKINSK